MHATWLPGAVSMSPLWTQRQQILKSLRIGHYYLHKKLLFTYEIVCDATATNSEKSSYGLLRGLTPEPYGTFTFTKYHDLDATAKNSEKSSYRDDIL